MCSSATATPTKDERLRVHLGLLERRNIKIWTDKDIAPGMKWQDEIEDALSRTKVAVLMISTDFLSSDFITKQELPPLLAAAQSEGVEILPVIAQALGLRRYRGRTSELLPGSQHGTATGQVEGRRRTGRGVRQDCS